MEFSLVLWNLNGNSRTVNERCSVFNSTYDSWQQDNMIPNVLLAQELYTSGLTTTWRRLSQQRYSFGNRHAACFFLKHFGSEIKFLDRNRLEEIMRLMLPNNQYKDAIERIHCGIVTIRRENILICSWHGKHTGENNISKTDLLRKVIIFVEQIRNYENCMATLVGGDFNLSSDIAIPVVREFLQLGAELYNGYIKPPFRINKIDYVIAWPTNRFKQYGCRVIETNPVEEEEEDASHRMFDHALIRYQFTVKFEEEWEGKGDVTWSGECVEGKVDLKNDKSNYVEVNGVTSGEWKGKTNDGFCQHFKKLTITGKFHFKVKLYNDTIWVNVNKNKTLTVRSNECKTLWWKGAGKVEWKGSKNIKLNVRDSDEQSVIWTGTGSVSWGGEGKASWVGGKLETWEGNQTVKLANNQLVRWSGGGQVCFEVGKLDRLRVRGDWKRTSLSRGHKWTARSYERNTLEWEGTGVICEVEGTGTGECLEIDT